MNSQECLKHFIAFLVVLSFLLRRAQRCSPQEKRQHDKEADPRPGEGDGELPSGVLRSSNPQPQPTSVTV